MASTTTATEQLQLIADLTRRRDELELEVREHHRDLERRATTSVRRCGRCRCPGHTRGRCSVFVPVGTDYLDLLPEQHERQQKRNDDAEVRRIQDLNRVPQTEYECVQEWANRSAENRERYELMSSGTRWVFARRGQVQDRARLDEAIARVRAQDSTPVRPSVAPALPPPPVRHSGGFTPEELERIQRNREAAIARRQRQQRPRVFIASEDLEQIERRSEGVVARRLVFSQATPSAPPQPQVVEQPSELEVAKKPIEETTCAICLEDLTDCNKTITACGHQYHTNCLMRCMRTTDKCPTCRANIM